MDDLIEAYIEAVLKCYPFTQLFDASNVEFINIVVDKRHYIVNREAIEVHKLLLDLAEDEGWGVEELEGE
jgi:hypothetical protein